MLRRVGERLAHADAKHLLNRAIGDFPGSREEDRTDQGRGLRRRRHVLSAQRGRRDRDQPRTGQDERRPEHVSGQ